MAGDYYCHGSVEVWLSLPKSPLYQETMHSETITFTRRGKRMELMRIQQLEEVCSLLLGDDTEDHWRV